MIRTSVIFWTLATIAAERSRQGPVRYEQATAEATEPVSTVRSDPAAATATPLVGVGIVSWPVAFEPIVPNPSRGPAEITWTLDRPARVRLEVHDLEGRRIATLIDGTLPRGRSVARWEGRDLTGRLAPPGIYFVRLDLDGRPSATTRLLRVR